MADIRGLSIRQPWPWAILFAGKQIENRERCSWHRFRGEVLLHASKSMTWMEHLQAVNFISRASGRPLFPTYDEIFRRDQPALRLGYTPIWGDSVRLGGIVGRARIVDAIMPGGLTADGKKHPLADDPWYVGQYGIVLADPQPVSFIACKGALGLWDVPPEILAAVKETTCAP